MGDGVVVWLLLVVVVVVVVVLVAVLPWLVGGDRGGADVGFAPRGPFFSFIGGRGEGGGLSFPRLCSVLPKTPSNFVNPF